MKKLVTKTFIIETTEEVMPRFERFLALLHYNSRFGHSNLFGMWLDGDGCDRFMVKPLDGNLRHGVSAIGGVGYNIEVALENGYSGTFIDRGRENKWYTKPSETLYKDGEEIKTSPGTDWEYKKGE